MTLLIDLLLKDTSSLSRSHVVLRSDSGLISIAGGKWTTYRIMAEHTVDEVLKANPEIKAKVTVRFVGVVAFAQRYKGSVRDGAIASVWLA